MKKENKSFELRRQIFHICLGLLIVALLYYEFIGPWTLFITLIIGSIISFISLKYKIPLISWFLKKFERPMDHPGKGAICFLIGTLLAIKLFPKDIALASIMVLALGDSISHYIGKFHGKIKHPFDNRKRIEGHIAGVIFGFIGALIFVNPLSAIVASFFAMLAEAMEIEFNHRIINDNISIPLVAGVSIIILRVLT